MRLEKEAVPRGAAFFSYDSPESSLRAERSNPLDDLRFMIYDCYLVLLIASVDACF